VIINVLPVLRCSHAAVRKVFCAAHLTDRHCRDDSSGVSPPQVSFRLLKRNFEILTLSMKPWKLAAIRG